jgi:hypothetical protein
MTKFLRASLSIALVLLPSLAASELRYFGFTNDINDVERFPGGTLAFTSVIGTIESAWSVNVNSGFWFVADDYTVARDLLYVINEEYKSWGNRYILDITNLIFVAHTSGSWPCSWYGSSSVTASPARPVYRLRGNWAARVDDFFDTTTGFGNGLTNGQYLLSSDGRALTLSVHLEANNGCVPPNQIATAMNYIRANHLGDGVPLAAGYATTSFWSWGTRPLPSAFPAAADIILTWNYGYFNPNDIFDPDNYPNGLSHGNGMTAHFNQFAPSDQFTVWGNVKSRLNGRNLPGPGDPTVIYGFEGGQLNFEHPSFTGPASHIVDYDPPGGVDEPDIAELGLNWCNWLRGRPEILGGLVAGWVSANFFILNDPLDPNPHNHMNGPVGSVRRHYDDCF